MTLLKSEKGFTFIELMILVAVVGIVAALAYPYFQQMVEKTREAATRANINAIKSAISIYYGDHEGVWPSKLDVTDKTPGFGFGDYLPVMPKVKATYPTEKEMNPAGNMITYKSFTDEPSLAEPNTPGVGWRYEVETGRIWINSSLVDSNGLSYTTYGYQ